MKEGFFIKLINKEDLKTLIDKGYVNASLTEGVSITSKNKNSRGKRYYAMDVLAFTAWYLRGLNPDDKDFQYWKRKQERFASKKSNYRKRDN